MFFSTQYSYKMNNYGNHQVITWLLSDTQVIRKHFGYFRLVCIKHSFIKLQVNHER